MNGGQMHLMLNHLPVMGALVSLLLMGWAIMAIIAAVALAIGLTKPNYLLASAIVVGLLNALVFGVMGYTAHLGGMIRHPEIRSGFTPPAAEGADEPHEEEH